MNRRTVASVCLFASLALHLASYFLRPAGSEGSAAAQLATAAAHPAATAAAALVETAGWVLLLPALMALWGEVRGRGAVLVGLGAWGAVLGVLGFTAGGVLNVITVDLARSPRGIAAFTAIQHDGVVFGVFVLAIMLGLVALVVLLAGVARAGLGGWWLPIAGAVSVVGDQMTGDSTNPLLLSAVFLPMAVALAAVGARLLTGAVQLSDAPVPVPA
jgi:hypothetical protein